MRGFPTKGILRGISLKGSLGLWGLGKKKKARHRGGFPKKGILGVSWWRVLGV